MTETYKRLDWLILRAPERAHFGSVVRSEPFARYMAATSGVPWNGKPLVRETRGNGQRRVQAELETVRISFDPLHDMEARMIFLHENPHAGQLPNTALKNAAPLELINTLANEWVPDLTSSPFAGVAIDPEILTRDVLTRILAESINGTPVDETLLDNVHRGRSNTDPMFQVARASVSDLDLKAYKAATGALVSLAAQLQPEPNVQGFRDLFRHGLIPLTPFLAHRDIAEAISLLTLRSQAEIFAAAVAIEPGDAIVRPYSIGRLSKIHIVDALEQIAQPSMPALHLGKKQVPIVPAQKPKVKNNGSKSSPIVTLDTLNTKFENHMEEIATSIEDSGQLVDEFYGHILGRESPLKDCFQIVEHEGELRRSAVLQNLDLWHLPMAYTELHKRGVEPSTSVPISILGARSADFFTESLIVFALAQFGRDLCEKTTVPLDEIYTLATAIDEILDALSKFHQTTVAAMVHYEVLQDLALPFTSGAWSKILDLPSVRNTKPDSEKIVLTKREAKIASLIYHLPDVAAEALLNSEITCIPWPINRKEFQKHLDQFHSYDYLSSLDQVLAMRAQFGINGKPLGDRYEITPMEILAGDAFYRTVDPIAQSYTADVVIDDTSRRLANTCEKLRNLIMDARFMHTEICEITGQDPSMTFDIESDILKPVRAGLIHFTDHNLWLRAMKENEATRSDPDQPYGSSLLRFFNARLADSVTESTLALSIALPLLYMPEEHGKEFKKTVDLLSRLVDRIEKYHGYTIEAIFSPEQESFNTDVQTTKLWNELAKCSLIVNTPEKQQNVSLTDTQQKVLAVNFHLPIDVTQFVACGGFKSSPWDIFGLQLTKLLQHYAPTPQIEMLYIQAQRFREGAGLSRTGYGEEKAVIRTGTIHSLGYARTTQKIRDRYLLFLGMGKELAGLDLSAVQRYRNKKMEKVNKDVQQVEQEILELLGPGHTPDGPDTPVDSGKTRKAPKAPPTTSR